MEFSQINLATHDHVDRRIVFGVLGGVVLFLAIFTLVNAVSGFQVFSERSDYRAKISDLQQQAKTLTKQDEIVATFDAAAADELQNRIQNANYLIALDVFPWITIMDELEKAIPPQVVLDRLVPSQDRKTIRINGRMPSVEPITRFQEALGKSNLFQSVVIENMDFGPESSAAKGAAAGSAMHFEMICRLDLKALFPEKQYGGLWMTLADVKAGKVRKGKP
jgi:Tfp pilus assembly protein PilN